MDLSSKVRRHAALSDKPLSPNTHKYCAVCTYQGQSHHCALGGNVLWELPRLRGKDCTHIDSFRCKQAQEGLTSTWSSTAARSLLCRSNVVKDEMRPNWSDNGIRLDLRGLSSRAINIVIMVKNYILSVITLLNGIGTCAVSRSNQQRGSIPY